MTQPIQQSLGTCGTCKFWEPPAEQPVGLAAPSPDPGRCHFAAPLVLLDMSAQTHWPKTLSTDWCGQFVAVP